jgi:hypothetical protein
MKHLIKTLFFGYLPLGWKRLFRVITFSLVVLFVYFALENNFSYWDFYFPLIILSIGVSMILSYVISGFINQKKNDNQGQILFNMKKMRKDYVHLIISLILLLPVAVMLENSDGLETVNDLGGYLKEWIAPIIFSFIISGIVYGIKLIFKKKSSFVNIFYITSYTLSIIILLTLSLKYL